MTTAIATTTIQSPHGAIFVRATVMVFGTAANIEDAARGAEAAAEHLEKMIADGTWTRPMGEAREEYRRAVRGEIRIAFDDTDFARLILELDAVAVGAVKDWFRVGGIMRVDLE